MKSSPGWEASYLGQLRAAVGNRMLITPGASAVIQDDNGQILLIQRSDNLEWAIPGGSMELGYSVYDTLVREVREETGLSISVAGLVGLYSESGSPIVLVAYAAIYLEGDLFRDPAEVQETAFFPVASPPPLAFPRDRRIIQDWQGHGP